ncbi:MAG: hypothetical protein E7429_00385 [Ruminococcaceae bacterium]|nr:hypothetical protein [Oscillospiraceae bacterium]
MEVHGFYTQKGLALSAKSGIGAPLTITRVAAGCGATSDSATQLDQPMQALAVNSPVFSENIATLPAILVAAEASGEYLLTEVGVFATDPDEGEILYKVYRPDAPIAISPASRMVLRFYLEETLAQAQEIHILCAPAGLITEEAFAPIRTQVTAAAVPSETAVVEASALQAYLDAIPKLLTKHLSIYVSGAVEEKITISSFYGSGSLQLFGGEFAQEVILQEISLPVSMTSSSFAPRAAEQYGQALYIANCANVRLSSCVLNGAGAPSAYGLHFDRSKVFLDNPTIQNFWIALQGSGTGRLAVHNGTYADNTIGAIVQHGAIITMGIDVDETFGAASNLNQGGLIVYPDGTPTA